MIRSPIKWAGGKTRVMPQLLKHLPKADCLIEPFVGSGTVFMNTEYRCYVLCDSNLELINFFRVLAARTDDLIELARRAFADGNNPRTYAWRRKVYNQYIKYAAHNDDKALRIAALFLYLNRHGFNGLYRVNQKGGFNVPFGKYAAPYFPEKEMRLFAEKANDTKAIFIHSDFRHSIPDVMQLAYDAVIYCDPPLYPVQQNRQLYRLRQALYPGRSSRPGCDVAGGKSPARHALGYLQQRHTGNPRNLFPFHAPRVKRPPFCQRQKPRYGWRGDWRASRVRLLWPFWWWLLPGLWPGDGEFHLRSDGGDGGIRRAEGF